MSENFFQFIAYMTLVKSDKPKEHFQTGVLAGDRVHEAKKKMMKMARSWPHITCEVPYKVKYRFVYDAETRYTISLFSDGTYEVKSEKRKIEKEEEEKLLHEFLNRFYHISVEILLKDTIGFPETRELPKRLFLKPDQLRKFLINFQQQIMKGKTSDKVVLIRHSELLKKNNLLPSEELKKFLVDTFVGNSQVFIDSSVYAQDTVEKKIVHKSKQSRRNNRKRRAEKAKKEREAEE